MPLEAAKFAWEIGISLVVFSHFVYAWWANKSHANKMALDRVESHLEEKIDALALVSEEKSRTLRSVLDDHSRRTTIAEEALKFAPKSDDISKLRDSITQLATNVARLEGTQEGVFRTVERMNQFLMERNK